MGARLVPGQRRPPGPRNGQRRPQEGGGLRRRAVQGGRPRAGRHLGLPAAGPVHVADDRRGAVEPGAGARRQGRTGRARSGGGVLDAHRSGAAGRGAARVRRLRPVHPRAEDRRFRRPGPPRQGRRLSARQSRGRARCAERARAVGRRPLGRAEEGRRPRCDRAAAPGPDRAAVGALHAGAPPAGDVDRRSRARRYRRPAGLDRLQPGQRRAPLRRIRAHLRRDGRPGRHAQAAPWLPAAGRGAGQGNGGEDDRHIGQRRRQAGRQRSGAARRIRRALGSPRSSRRRRRGERRPPRRWRDRRRSRSARSSSSP